MKKSFKEVLATATLAARNPRMKTKNKTKTQQQEGIERFSATLLNAPKLSKEQRNRAALRGL
jgi:hypothetical protein